MIDSRVGKLIVTELLALTVIFLLCISTVFAEEYDITVKYKTASDETIRAAELIQIGTVSGKVNKKINLTGRYALLTTLPNDAIITEITFGDSFTYNSLLYKEDGVIKTSDNFDQSLLIDNNCLTNGDFWNEDTESINYAFVSKYAHITGTLPVNDVKGFIVFGDNRSDTRDYVFIQIPVESETVDKTELLSALDQLPSEDDYYTSGDTWNGKNESESENGFWYDLQNNAAVVKAKELAEKDSGITQSEVDAATETLNSVLPTLKANLISLDNVNASSLYETKKIIDSTAGLNDEASYSSASWSAFKAARDSVDDLFLELYDEVTHKPTESNTAERAADVDNLKVLLESARDNLLYKDKENLLPRWRNVANWILSQDRNEAGYTDESWSTWSMAKEVLNGLVEQDDEVILKSKTTYDNFISATCDAVGAWYGLEAKADSITVHVRVVDNYGMRHPEYAIADERTAAFDGEITLPGRKTLQDLFDDGELDTSPKTLTDYEKSLITDDDKIDDIGNKFRIPTQMLHSHTYAYVNGKLVVARSQSEDERKDEIESATLTHFDIYGGVFNTNNLPLEDYFPVLKTQLSDGDDVVIIRTEAPLWHSFTASAGHLCTYADYRYLYHNFTELIVDGDQLIEAKPDDKITLTVKEEEKTVDVSDTNQKSAEGVNLFLSDPQISEEVAKSEPTLNIITEPDGDDVKPVETDDEGKVEFSVDKEGWYKLQPSKGGETLEIYGDLDGTTKDGIFPNLAVGKYIMLHVSLDDEFDTLTEPETAVKDAFDALETAEAAYEASKSAAAEAAETPGEEAVAAASQAVDDAEAAVKAAEDVKTAAEAYLEKVTELAEKKDQMSDAHKAEIEEALTKAAADVRKAENVVASGKEELADAKEVLDKAETKAALKKYQEEIAALKAENAEQQGRINELLTANETAQEEITVLKAANTASKEEISDLKDEIAANEAKIAELEEQGGDNEELIAELQAANETAQGKIGELAQTITANQTEIGTLKEQIAANQEEIQKITAEDPLAAARKEAIDKVNKYLEDNAKNILGSDTDSAELAALKALIKIKDAKTAEEITNAADAAIAKIDEKIAAKEAADEKAAKIKAAKAQKVKGLKVKVKKNKATVSWEKNTSVTGYVVYRSLKKKSGYKKVATIKKNTKIKFVNKNLKAGKKYYYKVRTFTTIDGKAYYGKYTKVKATKKIK